MNKAQFIDAVAEKAEMSKAAAARAVDAIFDTAEGAISEAVHTLGELSIPGFGKFSRKTRAAREGRNPRTGARIDIPERTTVGFTAGKNLRERSPSSRRRPTGAGGAPPAGGKPAGAGRPAGAGGKPGGAGKGGPPGKGGKPGGGRKV